MTYYTGQQQIWCLGFLCWSQKSHWFCSIRSTFLYSATL